MWGGGVLVGGKCPRFWGGFCVGVVVYVSFSGQWFTAIGGCGVGVFSFLCGGLGVCFVGGGCGASYGG